MEKEPTIYAPIVAGNYADPAIFRVGEDYYMTHSSYKLTPGLVIWHSRDLRSWTPVAAALQEYLGDVWAPDFAEYEGAYYIYFPANRSNWVVTAPHPTGPWSPPIDLGIKGIDPGHVAGPDGKRYLHMSGGEFVELAKDGLSVVSEPRHVYDGWRYPDDWVVEAYSLEGPKVTYHNGYYYLTVAIGGTAGPPTSHMAASSRSRTPWGPWEHSPYNPIVRTASSAERWWSKGHGSLVDAPDGTWRIVYHAYLNGFHTLGRQTLVERIEWTDDGWFRTAPNPIEAVVDAGPFEDDFRGSSLALHWQCEGRRPEDRFALSPDGLAVAGADGASPLLFMPKHERYEAEVEAVVEGDAEARLLLYYNDSAYLGIGLHSGGVRHFRSFKSYAAMPDFGRKARIRIRNDRHVVTFYYSFDDGATWSRYDKTIDASGLHHNTFGGFLSLRVGLDAVGDGRATFRRFSYRPLTEERERGVQA
ncbi:xylan 1,4-beta-xylosidase [Paenibacillus antri]|uniref:Xylan 1,4-beta-xylosidase n=1 Tax=Paenibacillus antri TaxID=2582848 RepID=A0A5R9G6Z5_9BACL|nr:family 43 glycosylhydrolase [Paenibacillus antri]TLS49218.1 xylan 1,4-beta-xylosidase [Paenibacillus antri]